MKHIKTFLYSVNLYSVKTWPVVCFLISLSLLGGAYGFQYAGYQPCTMCYWQRYIHMGVVGFCLLFFGFKIYKKKSDSTVLAQRFAKLFDKLFLYGIALVFCLSFGLAFWHSGVEYGWWEGLKSCGLSVSGIEVTGQSIFDALGADSLKLPSCTEAAWRFLGLSMAMWNAVISVFMAGLSFKLIAHVK